MTQRGTKTGNCDLLFDLKGRLCQWNIIWVQAAPLRSIPSLLQAGDLPRWSVPLSSSEDRVEVGDPQHQESSGESVY